MYVPTVIRIRRVQWQMNQAAKIVTQMLFCQVLLARLLLRARCVAMFVRMDRRVQHALQLGLKIVRVATRMPSCLGLRVWWVQRVLSVPTLVLLPAERLEVARWVRLVPERLKFAVKLVL